MELQIHSFLPVSEDSIYSRFINFSQSVGFIWLIYTFGKYISGGILHLRYENDIPMVNRNSRIVVRWRDILNRDNGSALLKG